MKSDKELRKVFNISIEDKDIIYVSFLKEERDPDSSVRIAELLKSDMFTVFKQDTKRKFKIIVDLSPLGKGGFTNSSSRKKYVEVSEHKQITKIAIIGGNVLIRTTTGLIFKAAGKGQIMKWFTNKTDAFTWLEKN